MALAEEIPEFLPTPMPLPVPLSREIGNPTQAPVVLPAGSPTPAASTTEPIALKVLTPIDGSGIEVDSKSMGCQLMYQLTAAFSVTCHYEKG